MNGPESMEYRCVKIEKDLVIDGDLSKPEWRAAAAVHLADVVTGRPALRATEARLLWNERFLYASFRGDDPFVLASKTAYNDRLYEEDVVELFIDDDADLKTYIEIEVNPLGAVLHYGVHNNLRGEIIQFARVDRVVRAAVVRASARPTSGRDASCVKAPGKDGPGGTFAVELAIPFSEFMTAPNNPPRKGDRWRMNLYRIDRGGNSNGPGGTGRDEYSAWCPTGEIDYHLPAKFGTLIFE